MQNNKQKIYLVEQWDDCNDYESHPRIVMATLDKQKAIEFILSKQESLGTFDEVEDGKEYYVEGKDILIFNSDGSPTMLEDYSYNPETGEEISVLDENGQVVLYQETKHIYPTRFEIIETEDGVDFLR
jgi:hypothetical protein